MGTGCISKISVSVSEDIYAASVRGTKNRCLIEGVILSQNGVGYSSRNNSNIEILNLCLGKCLYSVFSEIIKVTN